MEKIKRVERFKDEIKEAKMYRSLAENNSTKTKLIQKTKTDLEKLDSEFFNNIIKSTPHKIKSLEQTNNLDYRLKSKINAIQDTLNKDIFQVPELKIINTRVHHFEELKKLQKELVKRLKKFDSKIQVHDIDFNEQITELNKMKLKLKEKEEYFEEKDIEEISKIQANLFDKTNDVKLRLTQTTEIVRTPKEKAKRKKTEYKFTLIAITSMSLIIFIIFRGSF